MQKAEESSELDGILEAIKAYHPDPDLELITRAYRFAESAHCDQVRASGEPYFVHLVATAHYVARLRLDVPSICAAFLHDIVEDCAVSADRLNEEFGDEIAQIVEGVTKLTRIEFESREEKQAENFRKMLIAMAKDIRVVLVKLCDRLHNMQTLEFKTEDAQRRIARETKDIYAPLANRLGIHWLKSELEDLCLKYLRPAVYELIKANFERTHGEREAFIEETAQHIVEKLEAAGVSGSVKGRAKHYFSIWRKMEHQNLAFDEIYDLIGFRVIVPTVRACYETLGIIHSVWKPIPQRFKDYIAMPKPNMYQSLHTAVVGPSGKRIEVQIRTPEMHRIAEEGIAAHWRYKENKAPTSQAFDLNWVRDLVEGQKYLKNPDEFIQSVKGDLFPEEVFVFTPKGDLLRLPSESTPVDFAFMIHTDVGSRTTGARVNGVMVPLDTVLDNGDTVEVITSKNQTPNKDWLEFVKTSKAKQRIRSYLKSEERARSVQFGQEVLSKDLRKVKLGLKKLEKSGDLLKAAEALGFRTEDELYAEIGYGKLKTTKVLARVLPEDDNIEEKLRREASPLERIFQRAAKASRDKVGVQVSGIDDILVRFAKCCEPLPGDRIVGFITRGRGVTVHLANCAQVMKSDPLRQVDVRWDEGIQNPRRIRLTVHSQDQPGLLANVTQVITEKGANIVSAQIKTTSFGKAINAFELAINDTHQLDDITRAIEMVPGVIKVERVKRRARAQ